MNHYIDNNLIMPEPAKLNVECPTCARTLIVSCSGRHRCPTCAVEMEIRVASFVSGDRYAVVIRTFHKALDEWPERRRQMRTITQEQACSPDPRLVGDGTSFEHFFHPLRNR